MAEQGKAVPYTVTTGSATKIEITDLDGAQWVVLINLSPMLVQDTGTNNPDGTRKFNIGVTMNSRCMRPEEAA